MPSPSTQCNAAAGPSLPRPPMPRIRPDGGETDAECPLSYPSGIAVDAARGRIFVTSSHMVQAFELYDDDG